MNRIALTLATLLPAAGLSAQQCETLDTPIWAGQTIRSGLVTITNSPDYLRLDCAAFAPWQIRAVQIYAGLDPVPTTGGGNFSPGQFPYKTDYTTPVDSHLEMIPLAALGAQCGDTLYLAAHFEMVQLDAAGNQIAEETGWAHGKDDTAGGQWGWSNTYVVCCSSLSCSGNSGLVLTSTALARGQAATLSASGALAGETIYFLANGGEVCCGAGAAVPALGSLRLDLAAPWINLGAAVADGSGSASLAVQVPANAGAWAGLQAVIRRGPAGSASVLSNPLALPVAR